ncbi:CYIR protein [Plasmodium cynomolgi strain B]|uniref:CYIR protein n=1 Tax=Plasmodium cynomolgi (strain B) TaxID=1120755 RepID=K6V314_PLACD|nr:CYIR protein [Plasmodium cynomolgi strain B]GAB69715.1 CYIR protein [Plasmodium cynomolgi strain B]
MPLSEENNWEKRLPNLPAYQKYKKLDEVDIKSYNNDKCDKLANSDEGDKKLCKQILKNLSILKDKQDKEQKDGCFYFQYWFHEQIRGKYYNGNVRNSKYSIANKLFNLVEKDISSYDINQACNGYIMGTPVIWKEEKDLHDYFENFESIKCKDSDRDECQKYVKYVTYIDDIYVRKYDDCCYNGQLYSHCILPIKCDDKYDTEKLVDELKKQLQEIDKKKAGTDASAQEEERAKQEEQNHKKVEEPATEAEQRLKDEAVSGRGEQTVRGEPGALQPETLGISLIDSPEHAVNAGTTYNSGISSDTGHEFLEGVPSTLESVSNKVDSNFIRNSTMAVGVLGTIFFLLYYNMVTTYSILRNENRVY